MLTTHRSMLLSSHLYTIAQYRKLRSVLRTHTFVAAYKLMLNDARTELLHVSSCFSTNVPEIHINTGNTAVIPSKTVRDHGVILDSNLTMISHVNNVCRRALHALYRISKLRLYLSAENTEKLVHTFINSRLSNCNSIQIKPSTPGPQQT